MMKITESASLLLVTVAALSAACNTRAAEQVAAFTVQPERCIALNQGQMCYQKLVFQWQTSAGSRYCLHEDTVATPLLCWNGAERSSHEIEFASDRNLIYRIRQEGQTEFLASVEVEVAWVYRSTRKSFSRWRLF
jgi:hypothetical protein